MVRRIDRDKQRYLDIVKGKTREEIKRRIKKGDLLARREGKVIRVPIPIIDLPRIRYGSGNSGVGSGDAEEGDVVGGDETEEGSGQAGQDPGEHMYEEFTLDEFVEIISEEIKLPNIKPKGRKNVYVPSEKLKTINQVGPPGRLHKKRTLKNAMKRSQAAGTYKPGQIIVPLRPDRCYRSFKDEMIPEMNAVIFYMMDVSGSMGNEQKELVRTQNFWIDVLLAKQYPGLESRYLIHDASAKEVTRDDFYHTQESGGTMISSVFQLCAKLFDQDYSPEEWNAYLFYSSDGDNWSVEDTQLTFEIIDEKILPFFNLLAYTQVASLYGSGQFLEDLYDQYGHDIETDSDKNIVVSQINGMEDILGSIEKLFNKGK